MDEETPQPGEVGSPEAPAPGDTLPEEDKEDGDEDSDESETSWVRGKHRN